MKTTDNKKAHDLGGQGLIDCQHKGESTVTTLALSFNDVNFSPVQQDGQIWLTASELAGALGYVKSDAVTQVYERNKDEFNASMPLTLKLSVKGFGNGNSEKETRIFSLRGAHLIAMFAKTTIAKQFRKWVLDILDREVLNSQVESRQSISPEQQALLHEIVDRRSQGNRKSYAEMWARHNRHFKIPRYAELLTIHFPEAVHYLETMEIKSKPAKQEAKTPSYSNSLEDLAYNVSMNMLWASGWWLCYRDAIQLLNPQMFSEIEDRFKSGSTYACLILGGEKSKETNARIAGVFPFNVPVRDRCALLRYK